MARAARRRRGGGWWRPLAGQILSGAGAARLAGLAAAVAGGALIAILATYHAADPSLDAAAPGVPANALGVARATIADLALQLLGLAAWAIALILLIAGLARLLRRRPTERRPRPGLRGLLTLLGLAALAGALAAPSPPVTWPLAAGLGGLAGDGLLSLAASPLAGAGLPHAEMLAGLLMALFALAALSFTLGLKRPAAELFALVGSRPAEPARGPRA
ncbi:MAG: DNA translocase FtsK 4TM domain-containing protein, partial [Caulobacteraceae bacterium]